MGNLTIDEFWNQYNIKKDSLKMSLNFLSQLSLQVQAWVNKLNEHGISISMDGRGRATDNIYIERFWRTLKQDHVYPFPAENGTTLWKGIRRFMNHYNKEKTHQGVGRRTPESMSKLSA